MEAPWQEALCPDCDDRDQRRRENEQRQRDLATRRSAAGIPAAYHGRRLAELTSWPVEMVMACHAWASHGGGLYLAGPTGTGKTTAAGAAAWELLQRRPVRWVTAAELSWWAAAPFGSDDHEAARRLASHAGALVIDDFGEEPPTDSAALVLKQAIQKRIDTRSPLLVTSNLLPGDAAARNPLLGQRIASRLQGYCHVVEITGRDHRLRPTPNPR